MSLADTTPWKKPIGIENTFLLKKGRMSPTNYSWKNLAAEKLRQLAFFRGNLEVEHRTTTDPGCVEVPSPILRSWHQARTWYEELIDMADTVGLTPFRENHVAGGGHIHMGNLSQTVMKDMFRDMVFRPYVAWAFIDPVDDINGNSLLSESGRTCFHKDMRFVNSRWGVGDYVSNYRSDRSGILHYNYTYGTVEWRAFDSAADWGIQEQHIAVYQRYAALFLKNKYRVYGFNRDFDSHQQLLRSWRDLDKCIKAFREFIVSDLELPWRAFRWYVDRNLVPKHKNGWSQLI